jgi:hypothetical protein
VNNALFLSSAASSRPVPKKFVFQIGVKLFEFDLCVDFRPDVVEVALQLP